MDTSSYSPGTVVKPIKFGTAYLISKPYDNRVILKVVPAVTEARVKSGLARIALPERAFCVNKLKTTLGPEPKTLRLFSAGAR